MDGYQKKKYVCKLLFIFLLGNDIDFGHMEAVNLLSSNKYTEKQIVRPIYLSSFICVKLLFCIGKKEGVWWSCCGTAHKLLSIAIKFVILSHWKQMNWYSYDVLYSSFGLKSLIAFQSRFKVFCRLKSNYKFFYPFSLLHHALCWDVGVTWH